MPKSPFANYTPEQIFAYESVSYVIVVGSELFDSNGKFIFDKKSANRYFKKILAQVLQKFIHGNRRESANARRVLHNLRIEQLRIH